MFQLVVFVSLIFCWNFCAAEFYQDEPMGHFMEYSVEMPSSSSQASEPPTMFMRYGNIDKSGRYLRDFEVERPNYHHHHNPLSFPPPPSSSLSSDDEYTNSMPPFPFSLPYQYIDSNRYPKPEQSYNNNNHRTWNNNEKEYIPEENINNRNSWARVYHPSRDSAYHRPEPQQQYFESQPHFHQQGAGYVPTRFSSTVDEIQNRVFSMMHNIAAFPQPHQPQQPLHRGGHHRTGFSRESQYGYQMFI